MEKERYYSLHTYIKETFGEKMYKISLNGGMTCPNRDGTLGDRGCIFCSEGGSGDFAAQKNLSITEQIEMGKTQVAKKYSGHSYIAYFQAYTNTYAPVSYLERIFTEAIEHKDIKVLSIATRPDCLSDDVLKLLDRLNQKKPVWVELGLQSIHKKSAEWMRRGYELSVFDWAVNQLHAMGISVIVHVILGLPCESESDMLKTIDHLNTKPISGVKLQLLHVLDHTDLGDYYRTTGFHIYTMEEYFSLLGRCLNRLRRDIVIHRLTGDGPKSILIEPKWTGSKRYVLNQMQAYFKEHDIRQGKDCQMTVSGNEPDKGQKTGEGRFI